MYGCKDECEAWDDPLGAQFIGNKLRECNLVGLYLGFDEPVSAPDDACFAHAKHVITAWGDEQGEVDPLTENPARVYVTDSDQSTGTEYGVENYAYTWNDDRWYISLASSNSDDFPPGSSDPYYWNIVTLSEWDDGLVIEDSRQFTNDGPENPTGLQYKVYVGLNVRICKYEMTLDPPKDDEPRVVKYYKQVGVDFEEYLEVEWEFGAEDPLLPGESVTVLTHLETDPDAAAISYSDERFRYENDIPAVSDWGLIIMALLVLAAASVLAAKRQRQKLADA